MFHVSSDPGYGHGEYATFPEALQAAQDAAVSHWGNSTVWDDENKVIARCYPDNAIQPWIAEFYRDKL